MPNEDANPQQNTQAQKDHKMLLILLGILLVALLVFSGWYLFKPNDSETITTLVTPTTQSTEVVKISNDADLEKLEKDLNNLDIESLNDGLEDNDKDSAGF